MNQPLPRPAPQWGVHDITDAIKCIAHPRRAVVLNYLMRRGGWAMFKDIATELRLPAPTLSRFIDLYVLMGLMRRETLPNKAVKIHVRLDKVEALSAFFVAMWQKARALQGVGSGYQA